MHHLMSLANGESHNFTAEMLLREGTALVATEAQRRAMNWMRQQGLPPPACALPMAQGSIAPIGSPADY